AIADKGKTPLEHTAIGICRQQLSRTEHALRAAILKNPEGAPRAVSESKRLFLAALDTMRQQSRRQPRRHPSEMRVVYLRIGAKRAGQPPSAGVKPLARNRQHVIDGRQRATEQKQFLAMPVEVSPPTCQLARAKIGERAHEFGAHRHGHLRSSRWRR